MKVQSKGASKVSSQLRVLLTGAGGQLGQALLRSASSDVDLHAYTHQTLDMTQFETVKKTITECKPNLIINTAAYTQVDLAEQEPEKAYAANRDGAFYMAQTAAQHNIALMHISTDYVFDGTSQKPYTELDAPNPINVYGASKLAGEQAVLKAHEQSLIIRTSSVFGENADGKNATNFVTRILNQALQHQPLRVVDDQVSCPTAAKDLAHALWQLVQQYKQTRTLPWGVLHYAGSPACSRYAWAKEIIAIAQQEGLFSHAVDVQPCLTTGFPVLANRPAYSILDSSRIKKLCNISAENWQQACRQICQKALQG